VLRTDRAVRNQGSGGSEVSHIQASVELLAETLQSKNHDYTAGRDEFYNFRKAAEFTGTSVDVIILAEIAKKMTRLESLFRLQEFGQLPNNESLKDTLLDLAGYSVIGHAHLVDTALEEVIISTAHPTKTDWSPAG